MPLLMTPAGAAKVLGSLLLVWAMGGDSRSRHFEENLGTTRSYRMEGAASLTGTNSDLVCGRRTVATLYITWGRPYPETGIKVTCLIEELPTTGTIIEWVTFDSPALSLALGPYTGSDFSVDVQNVLMDVPDFGAACNEWRFRSTAIRFDVGGVNQYVHLGTDQSGTAYDQRENTTEGFSFSEITGESFSTAGYDFCPPTYAREYDAIGDFDYSWAWYDGATLTGEPVAIYPTSPPPTTPPAGCGACACVAPQPEISAALTTAMHVESREHFRRVITDNGTINCQCVPPYSYITFTKRKYTINKTYLYQASGLAGEPTHMGLLDQVVDGQAGCTCHVPLTDDDLVLSSVPSTQAITYARHTKTAVKWTTEEVCYVGNNACPELPGGQVDESCVRLPTSIQCYYTGQVRLYHPSNPCTGVDVDQISYDISKSGRHIRAFVRGGTIWTGYASSVLPLVWVDQDTGYEADSVCIRYPDRRNDGRIDLLITRGGNQYRRTSKTEGFVWSAESAALSSGTGARVDIAHGGLKYTYRLDGGAIKGIVYDDLDQAGTGFTAIASASALCDIREVYDHENLWSLILLYESGGTIYYSLSTDGINFSAGVSLGSGTDARVEVVNSRIRYVYRLDGTVIRGRSYDSEWTALESAFVAVAYSDGLGDVRELYGGGVGWRLMMLHRVGTDIVTLTSKNGILFGPG